MEDKDANQEALEQVRKATDSGPVQEDEELLESPELQRQWREAKAPYPKATTTTNR